MLYKISVFKVIMLIAIACIEIFAATAAASGGNFWTDDQCQRILNAVTTPGTIQLVSKKHPKEKLASMGIAGIVSQFSGQQERLRYELACQLFERAPASFDFSKFHNLNCPESAFIPYLDHLRNQKSDQLPPLIAARYPDGSTNNVSGYFLGCIAVQYGAIPDYMVAGPHFANFLIWIARSGSPLVSFFGDKDLARVHACYGLYCQRVPQKVSQVERNFKRAIELCPDNAATIHNLADWYTAQNNPAEAEKYKAIARQIEQQSGRQSQPDTYVRALELPGGRILPVSSGGVVSEATVRAQAHARIDNDPEFAGTVARGILSTLASMSPADFGRDSQEARKNIGVEIAFAHTWPSVAEKQAALRRITERIMVVGLDPELAKDLGKLFLHFDRECRAEVDNLQTVLRRLITQMVTRNMQGRLVCAHFIGLPGVAEEVGFIESMRKGSDSVAIPIIGDTLQTVVLNPLHGSLSQHFRKNSNKPPRNVLQILRANGVTSESALYRYWANIYRSTWEVEFAAAWRAAVEKARADHEAFWSSIPATKALTAKASAHSSGAAAAAPYEDDEEETEQQQVQHRYNPVATFAEAERRARMLEYAVPEAIASLLRLNISSSTSGGAETLVTLLQTNFSDGSETELTRFRPHRDHKAVWDVDRNVMTTFLWNLYQLQKQSK
jgi:hypothetical protein